MNKRLHNPFNRIVKNKPLIVLHISVICILVALIFGLSFGIIYPNILLRNQFQQTTCYKLNSNVSTYNYCYEITNTTLPNCTYLLSQNISGNCLNSNDNYSLAIYRRYYVVCDNYLMVNILFNYGSNQQVVSIDCQNNATCVNQYSILTNTTCYYDSSNPLTLQLTDIPIHYWEIIVVIVILILLLIFYIVINLTLFKKYIIK